MSCEWELTQDDEWHVRYHKMVGGLNGYSYRANIWNEDNNGLEHWQLNITRRDLSEKTNPQSLIERLDTFRGSRKECIEYLLKDGI